MRGPSRRDFLKYTTAGAVTASCPAVVRQLLAEQEAAGFKYSMCNETFVDWPQKKIFKFLAECGYAGVEIAPFTIAQYVTEVSDKQRARLRKQADAAGIEIVGLHWLLAKTEGLHLTSPDPEVRKKTAAYVGELAKFCSDLGAKVMIFGSPQQRNLPEGTSMEEGMERATEVLKAAMPTLEERGVVLALEPLAPKETNFMQTAAAGVQLAERVDSPHCKIMLDCKAMFSEPTPIPDLIRKNSDWFVHFHANDPNLRGPGMGDLDFVPIFEALKEVKFAGWVSVEVFDYSPGAEVLARESLAYMREVEAKVVG